MPSRIDIRNQLAAAVATLPGLNPDRVKFYKLDKVEPGTLPIAAVYLETLSSERGTFGRERDRIQDITVSLFYPETTDAEAEMCGLIDQLESAIEDIRDTLDVSDVVLIRANIAHDPNSNGRIADGHATFQLTYSDTI